MCRQASLATALGLLPPGLQQELQGAGQARRPGRLVVHPALNHLRRYEVSKQLLWPAHCMKGSSSSSGGSGSC